MHIKVLQPSSTWNLIANVYCRAQLCLFLFYSFEIWNGDHSCLPAQKCLSQSSLKPNFVLRVRICTVSLALMKF